MDKKKLISLVTVSAIVLFLILAWTSRASAIEEPTPSATPSEIAVISDFCPDLPGEQVEDFQCEPQTEVPWIDEVVWNVYCSKKTITMTRWATARTQSFENGEWVWPLEGGDPQMIKKWDRPMEPGEFEAEGCELDEPEQQDTDEVEEIDLDETIELEAWGTDAVEEINESSGETVLVLTLEDGVTHKSTQYLA